MRNEGDVPAAPTVELARFRAPATCLDTGAACTLLLIHRVDGWALYGLDLPGQRMGIFVSNDSMVMLARTILVRSEAGNPPTGEGPS